MLNSDTVHAGACKQAQRSRLMCSTLNPLDGRHINQNMMEHRCGGVAQPQ